ncbi:MAG TPA: NnrT protein, partial [Rhizobiales bacterium]|nr:NnrT protein [Hyphomicrobiales bacterium]
MSQFLAALIIFFLAHMIPTRTLLRPHLSGILGSERRFVMVYSLLSIALLAWLVHAAINAPYISLWTAGSHAALIPVIFMLPAFVLMTTAIFQPNPLSIAFSRRSFNPEIPGIVAITRHPVLWSFGLWAASHIPPNGDLVSLILFGMLAIFAFLGMARMDRRMREKLGNRHWQQLAERTSILPFAAILSGRAKWPADRQFLQGLLAGIVLYVIFLI